MRTGVLRVSVGVLGAMLGVLAGLVAHWFLISPSDSELEAASQTLVPAEFTAVGVPVVSGAWAPSLERGVVHLDATASTAPSLDSVAQAWESDGWTIVDRGAVGAGSEGRIDGTRHGMTARVTISTHAADELTRASISVGRGAQEATRTGAAVVGAVLAVGGAVGAVVVVQRRRRGDRAGRDADASSRTWSAR